MIWNLNWKANCDYFQDRIEGEQTFSVIRSNNMTQVQVGEIVVGDVILVRRSRHLILISTYLFFFLHIVLFISRTFIIRGVEVGFFLTMSAFNLNFKLLFSVLAGDEIKDILPLKSVKHSYAKAVREGQTKTDCCFPQVQS